MTPTHIPHDPPDSTLAQFVVYRLNFMGVSIVQMDKREDVLLNVKQDDLLLLWSELDVLMRRVEGYLREKRVSVARCVDSASTPAPRIALGLCPLCMGAGEDAEKRVCPRCSGRGRWIA